MVANFTYFHPTVMDDSKTELLDLYNYFSLAELTITEIKILCHEFKEFFKQKYGPEVSASCLGAQLEQWSLQCPNGNQEF